MARQLEKRLPGRLGPDTRAPALGSRRNGSAIRRDTKQSLVSSPSRVSLSLSEPPCWSGAPHACFLTSTGSQMDGSWF